MNLQSDTVHPKERIVQLYFGLLYSPKMTKYRVDVKM